MRMPAHCCLKIDEIFSDFLEILTAGETLYCKCYMFPGKKMVLIGIKFTTIPECHLLNTKQSAPLK